MTDEVMTMLLRYTGDEYDVSFVRGNYYEAEKFRDDRGEAWIILDESDDWYRYGVRFVEENFEIVTEDEQEFSRAV